GDVSALFRAGDLDHQPLDLGGGRPRRAGSGRERRPRRRRGGGLLVRLGGAPRLRRRLAALLANAVRLGHTRPPPALPVGARLDGSQRRLARQRDEHRRDHVRRSEVRTAAANLTPHIWASLASDWPNFRSTDAPYLTSVKEWG